MNTLAVMEQVGRRLRRRRRLLGKTQQSLGSECGTSFQQIHKYETGATAMSAAKLWIVARALEVPISYFYDGLNDRGPPSASGLLDPDDVVKIFGNLAPPQQDALRDLMSVMSHGS